MDINPRCQAIEEPSDGWEVKKCKQNGTLTGD